MDLIVYLLHREGFGEGLVPTPWSPPMPISSGKYRLLREGKILSWCRLLYKYETPPELGHNTMPDD